MPGFPFLCLSYEYSLLSIRPQLALLSVLSACLVAVLIYWTGLRGPYLLDDPSNLDAIAVWLDNKLDLQTVLFERGAGILGRPLSMATFVFNAWVGGYTPFSMKMGNLLIHLLCGIVLFAFLQRLLKLDTRLSHRAKAIAATVAAIWLLHPLHASTVLYVVQRMAQLSTLLILLGLLVYLWARERLQNSSPFVPTTTILIGLPLMTFLAFLAKENGILLPLLCAVLEIAYFTPSNGQNRPRVARIFLYGYIALPCIAALIGFLLKPGWIVGGYVGRDFTLGERLLSQGRALCDYIGKILLPNPPQMGVYTDDFMASTSLFSPHSTFWALLVLASISLATWHWRKRFPAVFFGWYFYLVAHSLESGVIALELYFEHRNYLPSMGLLLAIVALVSSFGDLLAQRGLNSRRLGLVLLSGVLLLLVAGTHGRARVWRSDALIAESSLQSHPDSLRANAYLLGIALDHGDMQRADQILANLLASPRSRNRSMGYAFRLFVGCVYRHQGSPFDLEAFVNQTPLPLTLAEVQPFDTIYEATREKGCGAVTDGMIGDALAKLADRAKYQPDASREKSRLRYQAASFYARDQDWTNAIVQGQLAWHSKAQTPVAIPLIQAQLAVGKIDAAEVTFQEALARSEENNEEEQRHLRWLRQEISRAKNASSASSPSHAVPSQ